ncbi:MAG: hypothetical protein J0I84_11095 [Terrimonas sp.]|nr:hypothetical protein [Terrimonas sp.]OJY82401.1 MAG: hypothetical protein BGP13_22280 [Sphingobacteriales bacterium 40-81]
MRPEMFIYFIVSLFSCSNHNTPISDKTIDEFIAKYNSVKFDEIKGISISQRSRNTNEVVYVIGKSEGNLPVYFVTYDLQKGNINTINKSNLEKSKVPDYFTSEEISNAVKTIRKYDFYFLSVDSSENVYINPFYINEPAYLLRLKMVTGDSIVRKGYVYELYKENWYLNKTRKIN